MIIWKRIIVIIIRNMKFASRTRTAVVVPARTLAVTVVIAGILNTTIIYNFIPGIAAVYTPRECRKTKRRDTAYVVRVCVDVVYSVYLGIYIYMTCKYTAVVNIFPTKTFFRREFEFSADVTHNTII